jgi:hypothetical protein
LPAAPRKRTPPPPPPMSRRASAPRYPAPVPAVGYVGVKRWLTVTEVRLGKSESADGDATQPPKGLGTSLLSPNKYGYKLPDKATSLGSVQQLLDAGEALYTKIDSVGTITTSCNTMIEARGVKPSRAKSIQLIQEYGGTQNGYLELINLFDKREVRPQNLFAAYDILREASQRTAVAFVPATPSGLREQLATPGLRKQLATPRRADEPDEPVHDHVDLNGSLNELRTFLTTIESIAANLDGDDAWANLHTECAALVQSATKPNPRAVWSTQYGRMALDLGNTMAAVLRAAAVSEAALGAPDTAFTSAETTDLVERWQTLRAQVAKKVEGPDVELLRTEITEVERQLELKLELAIRDEELLLTGITEDEHKLELELERATADLERATTEPEPEPLDEKLAGYSASDDPESLIGTYIQQESARLCLRDALSPLANADTAEAMRKRRGQFLRAFTLTSAEGAVLRRNEQADERAEERRGQFLRDPTSTSDEGAVMMRNERADDRAAEQAAERAEERRGQFLRDPTSTSDEGAVMMRNERAAERAAEQAAEQAAERRGQFLRMPTSTSDEEGAVMMRNELCETFLAQLKESARKCAEARDTLITAFMEDSDLQDSNPDGAHLTPSHSPLLALANKSFDKISEAHALDVATVVSHIDFVEEDEEEDVVRRMDFDKEAGGGGATQADVDSFAEANR